jgi:hypothetical protein
MIVPGFYDIHCDGTDCKGNEDSMSVGADHAIFETEENDAEFAAKQARDAGWKIDEPANKAWCPDCAAPDQVNVPFPERLSPRQTSMARTILGLTRGLRGMRNEEAINALASLDVRALDGLAIAIRELVNQRDDAERKVRQPWRR